MLYHADVSKGEKINYVDFTSLYPSTQLYSKYPKGHPEIITSHFKKLDQYFGLVKCKILPPRKLLHPVLPQKSGGRLKFPLCNTCAAAETQKVCVCSNEKRCLTGVWSTPELEVAVQKGYVIKNIYEVYHWPETIQYDAETGESGLFAEYISTFLKIKTEASGYPKWVKCEDDKDLYIKQFYDHQHILLEKDNIIKNEGLRSLAKLMLNSLWGKFAQRPNMGRTSYIYDPAELVKQIADPTQTVKETFIC